MNKVTCPFCNSDNVAKILYGYPKFSDELKREIDRGNIAIGGCVIHTENNDYKCNSCQRGWKKSEAKSPSIE